ncbi:epoxide hydrolase [Xylariales sp. PMI_506]|nr:epoxide hydrolase [Xylariales sp. PMI_506]
MSLGGKAASKEDHLVPNDPRVQHLDAQIGPYNYHYMLASPANPVATVLLVHGFPDLGLAWRYQVPFLVSLNLRVIVPDMLGYGKTSAPAGPAEYSHKKISGHLKALVEHVCGAGARVILGGHDWGGGQVWRMAMWYPEMTIAVFVLNVPFSPPHKNYIKLEEIAARVPSFRYQLQFASPVTENIVDKSPERLRQFLRGMYGGVGPNRETAFSAKDGIIEENLDKVGPALLLTQDMAEFYFQEYSRNGLHGPTNWYRTRKVNWEEELELTNKTSFIDVPAMVMMGEKDLALPPHLANGTEKYCSKGLKKELAKGLGHWAMWQDPVMVNGFIGAFLKDVLGSKVAPKL